MASAHPAPGLYRKSYDVDMDPLVELVQDTVGRHDSFALACTAKYYEDLGYPGHVNCSENFNGQVTPYGVAPRKGWEALNFFYNTAFDADNQLIADEPWSRPGDYVLLRAADDLLCASSACPDDIDPANGWEITDIHVRVYRPENRFAMAIAHRVTPEADPVMTQETAFHPRTSALTRDLVEYRGYWLPNCFESEGTIAEYWACREAAVIMDLSPLRKFEVLGPDAELLIQRAITRDARKLAVGQVTYTAVCNETGGMLDDATVYRLGDDNFRFVAGDPYTGMHLTQLAESGSMRAWVKPSTDQLHNLSVQGPNSREILRQIVDAADPAGAREAALVPLLVGRIGDYDGIPIVVSRPATRASSATRSGVTLTTAQRSGTRSGRPEPATGSSRRAGGAGHAADRVGADLRRIRVRRQIDPFEAGIGFAVALDDEDDFVGKDALVERKAHPQRVLVGLELAGHEVAAHGECVHVGRSQVGVITSATRSPVLRKNIALCRMAVQYAEPGTEVEVGKLDSHQKRLPATVVSIPFYDPEKKRRS